MSAIQALPRHQRARGTGRIATQVLDGRTRLTTLFQEGCAKIRLPHTHDPSLQAVLINTAGGLTGGDDVTWHATAAPGARMVLTTQACERVYRSLGDDARVHDGRIGVTFNAGQDARTWTSRLDRTGTLALTAPSLGDRAETWVVQSSPMWHLDAQGVPGTQGDDGLTYRPLPGETLHVAVTQPKPVGGDSLAFDKVEVQSSAGDRSTETTLTLKARSTRGGEHAIGVPVGSELLEARRDGATLSLAIRNNTISLPLWPGTHVYTLRLREPVGMSLATRTPVFALNAPAANIALHLFGVVIFYGLLAAALLTGNYWLLLLLPASQLVGLVGHVAFERSYIDLQDAVFSYRASRCLNRMFYKILAGQYGEEIRRKQEALKQYRQR